RRSALISISAGNSRAASPAFSKNKIPAQAKISFVCAGAHLQNELLLAWIVAGIHVIELHRRLSMDLDYDCVLCHRVVMHVWIKVRKTSRRKGHHAAFIELVAHSYLKRSRNYRHVLTLRMPMRRNLVSSGHFQPHGILAARRHWISLQHG